MISRTLLTISLLLCLDGFLAAASEPDADPGVAAKPNVVFILADDLGWRDLSGEGSTFYESPHIDRIANEGMRFTYGYAACQVCSPSRASILTGKYPARLKITDWIGADMGDDWDRNTRLQPATYQWNLPHADTSMAEAFREAGYRTFFAGKWHLGKEGSWPEDHGFDINVGGHHRGSPPGGFFSPYHNPKMSDGPAGEHLPLRLGEETANFIRDSKDKPFFAYLSFYSVHAPIQSTEALWKKYRAKAPALPDGQGRFLFDRTMPVRQVQDNPLYGGMVEAMDDAVGLVLAAIDQCDIGENTIVVFTSDNGGVSVGDGFATSNLPLRGGKGRQWEGGIREPYYIRFPAVVAKESKCETPVTGTDFYPTLLDLAGIEPKPDQHVDGVSLVPLLQGKPLTKRDLFWHYPHYGNQGGEPSTIIQRFPWKLIRYHEDNRSELYRIDEDPGEQTDLASDQPEKATELGAALEQWLESVDARMPTVNQNFDEAKWNQQIQQSKTRRLERLEKSHAAVLSENYKPPRGWLWEKTKKMPAKAR